MGELCFSCFQEKNGSGVCEHCGFDPDAQARKYPLALPLGTILNARYIVGRVLGQGGFGITYLAQDFQTKQRVAVKEYMPSELSTRSGRYLVVPYSGQREKDFEFGKKKFLEEAQILAEFNGNPNIANIYQYFEEESTQTAYFVMEYVSEVSLESYVKSRGGRLSPEEANNLLLPVMRALNEVHQKNIVHRDIAPDNILLTSDLQPKLIDFGAARSSTGNKSMSMDVVVKHGFAPREQYSRQGKIGPYTDVYSMGATWYYTITGRIPPESIDRAEEDGLILPGVLGVRLPEKQLNALLTALAVRAEDRYQSMEAFANDIEGPFYSAGNVSASSSGLRTEPEDLIKRAFGLLEQGVWDKASSYLSTAADLSPDMPMAYIGLLMAQRHVKNQDDLPDSGLLDEEPNYQRAVELADPDLRLQLETWAAAARGKQKTLDRDKLIKEGKAALKTGKWETAIERFEQVHMLDPQNVEAHLGILLANNKAKDVPQLVKSKTPLEQDIHFGAVMAAGDSVLREQLGAVQRRKAEIQGRKGKKWFFPLLAGALILVAAALFFNPFKPEKKEGAAPTIILPTVYVDPVPSPETTLEPALEPTLEPTPRMTPEMTEAPAAPETPKPVLPTITIRPVDSSKAYDGTELRSNEYYVEGKLDGYKVMDVKIEGALTDVGTGKATITSFLLYDKDGNQIPEDEIKASGTITVEDGSLTVTKRSLTVTAVSANLTTGGETIQASEINENGFSSGYKADGLVEGQSLQGSFVLGSGARTFVTRIDPSCITVVDSSGKDVTACYDIRAVPGKVTITVPPLRCVVSEDCSTLAIYYQSSTAYEQIRFALWSEVDGQDDLRWYSAAQTSRNNWEYYLNLQNHRSAGVYHVHVYGVKDGESTLLETQDIEVDTAVLPENYIVAQKTAGIGGAVRVVLNSSETYTSVKFAVWTTENDQDDLQWYEGKQSSTGEWYCTFKQEDHPGKTFMIHCYAKQNDEDEDVFIDGITRYWT